MATATVATRKLSDLKPNKLILDLFAIDPDVLVAITDSVRDNGILQPLIVGNDGIVIDGHTRFKAAESLKLKEVPVKVLDISGTSEEAMDLAFQLQAARRNLTPEQKVDVVRRMLSRHADAQKWSDRRIAGFVGVSPTTVGKIRAALKSEGQIEDVSVRETASGKKIDVTKHHTRNAKAKKGKGKPAATLPSALRKAPEITTADLSKMEFEIDELNALTQWGNVIGAFLRTNPKAVSKAARQAEEAAKKQAAKEAAKAEELERKAKEAREKAEALKSGKAVPAKKGAAKKGAAKKGAAKKGK